MNEVLLVLLTFGLGIPATILAQVVSRRFRLADARRKRKLEGLQRVRAWMETYRTLFRCEYPLLDDLIFAHRSLDPDSDILSRDKAGPSRVYEALREFREAKAEYEEAERAGREAVEILGKRVWWDRLIISIENLFTRRSLYLLVYPGGFPRAIARDLEDLGKQEYKLFERFPTQFARGIDWEKLDFIEPQEVHKIIHSRLVYRDWRELSHAGYSEYTQREIDLADERDQLRSDKRLAERAIDNVLSEIRKYEDKWLVAERGA